MEILLQLRLVIIYLDFFVDFVLNRYFKWQFAEIQIHVRETFFTEPTVLMAPVTQNAKPSPPVQPVLDVNETKQWWQLEEVLTSEIFALHYLFLFVS